MFCSWLFVKLFMPQTFSNLHFKVILTYHSMSFESDKLIAFEEKNILMYLQVLQEYKTADIQMILMFSL